MRPEDIERSLREDKEAHGATPSVICLQPDNYDELRYAIEVDTKRDPAKGRGWFALQTSFGIVIITSFDHIQLW